MVTLFANTFKSLYYEHLKKGFNERKKNVEVRNVEGGIKVKCYC